MLNEWIRFSTDSWQSAFKMFHTMWPAPMNTEACDAFIKGAGALKTAGEKQFHMGCRKAFQMYCECSRELDRFGESSGGCRLEDIQRDMFRKWTECYEKEVRPVLNAPQLGLTRSYQEKLNQAIDRSNVFQAAMSELMQLLYVPVRESFRTVQQEFEQQASEGNFPEDFNGHYRKWIETLESHYMDLFQSPSYLQALHQVLQSAEDCKIARDGILSDLLKALPIPTNRDMDELYKEIYNLKKKVQRLSQRETSELYLLNNEGGHA